MAVETLDEVLRKYLEPLVSMRTDEQWQQIIQDLWDIFAESSEAYELAREIARDNSWKYD